METTGEKKYNTFYKTRFNLFVRSYIGYSVQNYLKIKYKIDSNLTEPQLRQQFSRKRAMPEISRLSRALNLNYQLLWQFMVLGRKRKMNTKINPQDKLKAYLGIENEIVILKITRQEKENIIHEDYERALLSPAIERAAGNSLKNIKDDLIFEKKLEELQKRYQRWYYEIAHEYKLPTLVNFHFILILIS
ncbi:hypothetical protein A3A54_02200 [Candidatus Curtissbacteria bacterium RIFCSPLOWO2_01_FULL_39_62]|uniref:Uncharacterized protein n=2 Tax=Candidatus Curtissiibacteriota TaxID=1752717 RepID=A0A1F5GC71_9BACT|nr:MAG: hypothetical protein A2775_01715 [Candidatus Curtissbacteria bacterium RIFCSPHIGHO2_01_FULL_39_57]OGD89424.1 MAG: hypothetical protein A3D04_04465 [Candidatus Curtissbacteria bacterium RIFCSPHIGHO2_02_FULL_40_16b]OGE00377.1 MAG: hypothetical protein A3J17_02615 [Candidatus Curtissbacteria bacterium RIFCSPLOWO2_02_FULL_40_11]OGE01840.1 MAG: hypothetical protein A3A54_02200 [Candidatus Curtissbacteria bacterium RIFCSPLOWO2_01_FULL_39_62]OGE12995.1 MAG: hypothetical protein A3G14_03350 [Ca